MNTKLIDFKKGDKVTVKTLTKSLDGIVEKSCPDICLVRFSDGSFIMFSNISDIFVKGNVIVCEG